MKYSLHFCLLVQMLTSGLLFSFAGAFAQKVSRVSASTAYYCTPCGNACDSEKHDQPGNCSHCGMALVEQPVAAEAARSAAPQSKRMVAILVYEGMEILDFAGPSEVFAATEGFQVFTVAVTQAPIVSQGFITIIPTYSLQKCPLPDIVVLPGGNTGPSMESKPLIDWLVASSRKAEVMLSVCTGAGLLSKAGLLDGKKATTFHNYLDDLQRATPKAEILRNTRFVDNGQIVTTAGVSAGIDGALHVVARLKGLEAARRTAQYMEYDKWTPNEGLVVQSVPKK